MLSVGHRLMLLGAAILLGAGIYWVAMQPTEGELETARFVDRLQGIDRSTNDHRLEAQAEATKALWPAMIGVVLLGVGWAMGSGGPGAPGTSNGASSARKGDDNAA